MLYTLILKFLNSVHISVAVQLNLGCFSDGLPVLEPAVPATSLQELPSTEFVTSAIALTMLQPQWLLLLFPASLLTFPFSHLIGLL